MQIVIIFNSSFRESVQNRSKKRSVLIRKDENDTAGINKKTKQPDKASFLLNPELKNKL